MFSNLSLSSFLDRVTLLERPLGRAREFFQGSNAASTDDDEADDDDEEEEEEEERDSSEVTNVHIPHQIPSSHTTDLVTEASSCDLDALETEDEDLVGWSTPQNSTITLVTGLYEHLWQEDLCKVNLALLEKTLSRCSPKEDVLAIEDMDHYNLMHKAVIFNSVPMMQIMLSHGCDASFANRRSCLVGGESVCLHVHVGVLHLACYLGRTDIVELLLRWGADKTVRRRVCSSAALHCPAGMQPDVLVSCNTSEKEEILTTCGAREPVFFAVLGDQVDVVRLFVKEDISQKYIEDLHLLHLACRIGARRCLEYFISVNPSVVNTFDTDGMPTLLLAMKHGLRYVSLILESGCDVTIFNDLWERGANIYHFLFSALPIGDEDHVTLCDILRHISKNKLVDINSKRESSGSSPLHELLHAANRVPRGNGHLCDINSTYLISYDQSVIEGIQFLLESGADIHARDISGDSLLDNILSNRNHMGRIALVDNLDIPEASRQSLTPATFGTDNLIKIVQILLSNHHSTAKQSPCAKSPISVFLKTLCTFDNDSEEDLWKSPFELSTKEGVFEKYVDLLTVLLERFDPNACAEGELTPLFYLLSQATLSPDADDYMYVISADNAWNLAELVTLLLSRGAQTECELSDSDGETIRYSCMDVLIYFLRKMQAYPHSRTAEDLHSLKCIMSVVFQYGGKPYLHNARFYHGPDMVSSDEGYGDVFTDPTFTFLYQYLCFGAMNLQYVNNGEVYYDLLNLLVAVTPQQDVYRALQSARLVFSCMHWPESCDCGLCVEFHQMLRSYLITPRSLKQLCRLTVRENVNTLCPFTISQLKLPTRIESFILILDV